jgi:two-component system cell cycle response regulator
VLLPETDALGARMFIRRSQEAFSTDDFIGRMSRDYPVSITLGAATFPLEGKDFDELLGVCRERSDRTRQSLYRRLKLQEKGFWEVVQLLVGSPEDYGRTLEAASQIFRLCEDADGGSAHGIFSEPILEGIGEEVARQAVDMPSRRAILIDVGGVLGAEQRPVERVVAGAERAKAFVIGRKGQGAAESDHPALTRVFLDDEMMDRHRLLLVLSEHLAYAFLAVAKDAGEMYAFNSHDHYLVENLITKLQEHYNLQRQY